MFGRVLIMYLRLYFHYLFVFGIILNLEFPILAKTMFASIQKGIWDSTKFLGWRFWSKFEQQIGPRIFNTFYKINFKIYVLFTLRCLIQI